MGVSIQYAFLNGIIAFAHLAAVCRIQLFQYSKGKIELEKIDQILYSGSTNWFVNKDLHLLLAFHAEDYQEGYRNFVIASSHRQFKLLPNYLSEKFQIWEAYLHFLVAIKKVIPDAKDRKFIKFRKGKFLNSVPVYSKDKRGLNIPILIIQILFTIVDGKYDLAVDRIEAIDKYCSRYLKQGSGFRSNCFIKMLNQIPLAGFHRVAAERKAKPYLEKLKAVPLNIAEQPEDVELISYEKLWALIIEYLGNNTVRKS